ncbi:lysozyme inhibitor LprI family protein [Serratia sp. UGAL515B_01]|uniref:lysozyme inhibitor LprI family protein n=1 Tax=Serratia sp. UGAL515B_01 TaxID=2986763 RepID=UPI002953108E|nr:lysozyme inhibitor LprI family protein [Serratia sp. UGAL515B_01]WON76269.1 DUF1311 domain-containing protein [Serratia sp. UGAL515B_01]
MKKFIIICFFSFGVYAQDDCNNITDSNQAYVCSYQKKDEVSLKLKKEYELYISEINKSYSADIVLGNKLLEKVKMSQSKWIEYMNSTCDVYAFHIEENSRTHSFAINNCISDMTEKRIHEISQMIGNI